MEQSYIEYFHGNNREIENEKQRKRELMSHFPKMLGTVDETRYVLQDDDKANIWSHYGERNVDHPTLAVISNESEKSKEQKDETTAKTISFDSWKEDSSFLGPKKENRKRAAKLLFDFDGNTAKEEDNPFQPGIQIPGLGAVGGNQPRTTTERNDSLALESMEIENRLDSVLYNDKGHMSVTFRNDVIGIDGFKPFNPSDRAGCKRRCMEMLAHSGCELSGERIDMTVNNDNGRAIAQSADFQKGINAIDNALDKKQTIILNVDYKDGTASSADRAGDHFIIIVGRTIIDGIAYYHFYDPATQFADYGTANTNVLYVKDGFLQGSFIKRNGSVNKYKVTSVRLNK